MHSFLLLCVYIQHLNLACNTCTHDKLEGCGWIGRNFYLTRSTIDRRKAMETASELTSRSSDALYNVEYCIWSDLSYAECERLLDRVNSHDDIKTILQGMLKADVTMETACRLQAQIITDLYAYGVIFARKSNYSPIQLSTLFSILKRVHEACISTPFDNLDTTMKMFQELMVKHSVERPPYSTSVFNIAEVKAITDYVLTTYFKHFKLYKFAFTKKVRLDLNFGPQSSESNKEAVQEREGGESSSKGM